MRYQSQGYGLEVVREPADGPVVSVLVHHAAYGGRPASWSDDDLTRVLREAREMDGDRDPRSEAMPGDDSLLRACLADLCIEVGGEAVDAVPVARVTPTPGPWSFDPPFTIMGGDDPRSCGPMPVAMAYGYAGTDTREANARLIAGAPDLLAALTATYAAIDAINLHDDAVGALNRAGLAHGLVQAQRLARAAIAKVGG